MLARLIAAAACTLIALTARSGCEILYVATPATPGASVSRDDLVATTHELAKRASANGVAEPEVRVDSPTQIRMRLAGVEAGNQAQSLLARPALPLHPDVKWTNTVGGVLGAAGFAATLKAGVVALGFIFVLLALVSLLTINGVWGIATRSFNCDIDFKAGTALDVNLAGQAITKDEAINTIAGSGIGAATLTIAGLRQDHVEARFGDALPPQKIARIVDHFKAAYGDNVACQENTADPALARALVRQALFAVALSLAAPAALVSWRFGWRFAVATMAGVVAAAYLMVAEFSLFHLEIEVTFIAAILTVMGTAVNDCVVTFDRIRENLGAASAPGTDLRELINRSIAQVLRRSLLTLLTVMAGAVSLYFLGAAPLQMFSLAIFCGLAFVACTTLFVAVPAWVAISREWPSHAFIRVRSAREVTQIR